MASFSVPPAERAARRVGSVLAGKYAVERVIGSGGMATVYQGVHRNGRRVAIKLLHEELSFHREMRARFVREGYVANAIDHPGAVSIFDDDEADDGAPFLVMELLEGETLADRSSHRGGKLPCREVCALAHQLLDVLAAAHERGVVHRDIKPENLFLTTSCALKVLDFGIARMHDEATGSLATVTGMRIGTPAFMPPEQALGRTSEIDARTDLWAAGATMFALLAGRTVHVAQHAAEVIVISATTPPRPLCEFAPEVPAPIAAVIDRAIMFAQADRWAGARAMQEALEQAFQSVYGEPLDPMAVGPKPVPRVVVERAEDERETAAAPLSDHSEPSRAASSRPSNRAASSGSRDRAASSRPLKRPSFDDLARGSTTPAGQQPTTRIRANRAALSRDATLPSDSAPDRTLASERAGSADARATTNDLGAAGQKGDPTLSPATLRPRHSSSPPRPGRESVRPPESAPRSSKPRDHRRFWPVAAVASAALAAFGMYAAMRPPGQATSGQATTGQATSGQAFSAAPAKVACAKNADCKGGEPSICRKADGVCVQLSSPECRVIATPEQIANDATVWFGAMFPVSVSDPMDYGPVSVRSIDLARRDFMETSGGLPPLTIDGPKRPIGVVSCDDRESPEIAARHLVNDVRVPVLLGFGRSKEVIDLAGSLFLPKGVLALAANTASALRDIPSLPGGPRLVYRVTSSTDGHVPLMSALVAEVIEPELHRTPGLLKPGEPVRIALLRVANTTGQSLADGLFASLRWNGKSVVENGSQFRQVEVPDTFEESEGVEQRAADQIIAFQPHILIGSAADAFSAAIESRWPERLPFRPRWLIASSHVSAPLSDIMKARPEARQRYFLLDGGGGDSASARYHLRYNEVFTPHITGDNGTPAVYDAFYVAAYAAAALGSQPITGTALSQAIGRLSSGPPVEVGPGGIFKAFYALGAGKSVDLQGAMTTLDFDPQTGDAPLDYAVYCVAPSRAGEPVHSVPTGLVLRAAAKKLEGAHRCP